MKRNKNELNEFPVSTPVFSISKTILDLSSTNIKKSWKPNINSYNEDRGSSILQKSALELTS